MAEQKYSDEYMALMGMGPKNIPMAEPWSCPDAETYATGIDYYDHPRQCRLKLREMYPKLHLGVPDTDDPKPRPKLDLIHESSTVKADGRHAVRWGDGTSDGWDWGKKFHTADDVFAFSPLEFAGEFGTIPVVESRDYSDEEALYQGWRNNYPEEWGDRAPEGSTAGCGFYNTMFMWPLLTFGWELFLETCLDPRFERIMDEFAEINRRVFRSFARLPVNFLFCHDDIVTSRGPVCSPAWMNKYIYPRYEEFWGMAKATGKEVIFMVDGNADQVVDNIVACGARGIITEPHTDFRAIVRKHKDFYVRGEGDNRILMGQNGDEIDQMVRDMLETAKMTGGYCFSIGNHIPWNVPPAAVKRYLDRVHEWGYR